MFYIKLLIIRSESSFGGDVGSEFSGVLGVSGISRSGDIGILEFSIILMVVDLVSQTGIDNGDSVNEHFNTLV